MARRKSPNTVGTSEPAPERQAGSSRSRRWLWVVGVIALLGGMTAWWLAGALVARAAAKRLPALPPALASVPRLAAEAIVAADRAARSSPSAASIGELAMTYHANIQPAEALRAYAVAEMLAPQDGRWPYYQGLLLIEQANHAPATAALGRVESGSEYAGLARLRLGEILSKMGEADGARRAFQEARTAPRAGPTGASGRAPRVGGTIDEHAAAGLASLDRDAAAAAPPEPRPLVDPLLDELSERSHHPDFLLKYAALAGRGGDLAWRERLATRAVEAQPDGLDVLLEMAATLQEKEMHTDALAYLKRAEAIAPGDHHTLVEQGQSLMALKRLVEAEEVLRRATRVRDATAEYNLANVLDLQDRWGEAQLRYERALAINPFHTRALNNLAIGLGRRGHTARAIALHQRAAAIAPLDADPFVNLSAVYLSMQRFPDALDAADRAIQLDERHVDAHNNRGIALAQLGRNGEARAAFEAALKIDPRNTDARRNLTVVDGRR
jgi:tetratricopeptide (TPR) repeat protein